MIQVIQFAGDFFRYYFIISPSGLASSFPQCRNFSKGASKFCVSIFFTRLLHRPWPLLANILFGNTHQVVNWRWQRLNVEMFEICMFPSTVISIHMLIQTRMILVQNSNVPGDTCVIIVGKCCWTKVGICSTTFTRETFLNKIASTNNQPHRFNAATYACLLTCSGAFDWCRWTFNVEK